MNDKIKCLHCGNVFCKKHYKKHSAPAGYAKDQEGECIVCKAFKKTNELMGVETK